MSFRNAYGVNKYHRPPPLLPMIYSKPHDPIVIVMLYHDLCDAIAMINTTLTFPLIFVIFHFFVSNLFASFNHVWTFVQNFKNLVFVLTTDGSWLLYNYILQGIFIHSSVCTSREAKETAIIISKIVNSSDCDRSDRDVFRSFLMQNQYRNLELQTPIFTINWKLCLNVSCLCYSGTKRWDSWLSLQRNFCEFVLLTELGI